MLLGCFESPSIIHVRSGFGMVMNMRPGDWMCPSCNNHNYANRMACNKCSAPKLIMFEGGCGGYNPVKVLAGTQRADPYGSPGLVASENTRPGDWTCPSCNNHNYANRIACNRCKMPKMESVAGALGGMGGPGEKPSARGGGGASRLGDWNCKVCGRPSPEGHENCDACEVPKGVYVSKTGFHDGDWICGDCGNHNYADKTTCNRCKGPRANALSLVGQGDGSGGCGASA